METQAPIIAFLYDFDKTLCTTDMEDYAFIPSLGSVSYTHLDVYKRQVPHHMIAVAEPSEQWSAAEYVAKATPIVDDILSRGCLLYTSRCV